jgi:hypothetical protein
LPCSSTIADPVLVAERRAEAWQSRVTAFSMFALPIQTQAVYGVLLMMPIGALVIVILRNLVGITTFGTFMPVLMALAFRETQLLGGSYCCSRSWPLGLAFRFFWSTCGCCWCRGCVGAHHRRAADADGQHRGP